MTQDKNLSVLKTDPDETRAQVERVKRALTGVTELAEPLAVARWAHYAASIEQGFTPEQAFHFALEIEI